MPADFYAFITWNSRKEEKKKEKLWILHFYYGIFSFSNRSNSKDRMSFHTLLSYTIALGKDTTSFPSFLQFHLY